MTGIRQEAANVITRQTARARLEELARQFIADAALWTPDYMELYASELRKELGKIDATRALDI